MSIEQRNWPAADDHDEQIEELVAAQALGSIEPADAEQLRTHLPRCERCRWLLAEYGVVVDTLPLAVELAPASPRLKSRLMAAVQEEVARGTDEAARPVPPESRPLQPAPPPADLGANRWPNRRLAWALPLAAVVLISIGLGWWNRTLQTELQAQRAQLEQQQRVLTAIAAGGQRVALTGTERAPAASGEVIQPPDGGPPLLLARGLPGLPPSQVYQVWVISNGQPTGVGLLNPPNGATTMVPLNRPIAGAEVVALTVEPPGGSPSPTGPIVLAGKV